MLIRQELEALLYSSEEAAIIYPKGDETPIKSIEYVDTDSSKEKLRSHIDANKASDKTESVFEHVNNSRVVRESGPAEFAQDATESVFGDPKLLSVTPKKKRRVLPIVLGALVALIVVLVGLSFLTGIISLPFGAQDPTVDYPMNGETQEYSVDYPTNGEEQESVADYITIRDVQHNKSLTELDLSGFDLTDDDIVPLRYMINLTTLRLGNNQISDLTPLQGLENLEVLNLSENNIEDITPLSDLVNLDRLALTNNPISDWSPVMHVPNIWGIDYITINGERYSVSLTELDLTGLDLTDEDIVPLRHMTNLTTLRLGSNQISDLAVLSELDSLTTLNISNNNIIDVTPLSNLVSLSQLDLANNPIDNESPVMHVPYIWGLNYIIIRAERYNVSLTELDLSGYDLTDEEIVPLRHMTNLTELMLGDNLISDLTPLTNLTNLIALDLGNNEVEDLTPLADLTNLEQLDLTDNPVIEWVSVAQVANVLGRPALITPEDRRADAGTVVQAPPMPPTPPTIDRGISVPPVITSVPASFTIRVNGSTPMTWSVVSGELPGGLSLNRNTGVISGTPAIESSDIVYRFTVQVENAFGSDTMDFVIDVLSRILPTNATMPRGRVGVPFSVTFSIDHSRQATWDITPGELPDGLNFNPDTRQITGTPVTAGTFTFSVRIWEDLRIVQRTITIDP
jgi:internalin A